MITFKLKDIKPGEKFYHNSCVFVKIDEESSHIVNSPSSVYNLDPETDVGKVVAEAHAPEPEADPEPAAEEVTEEEETSEDD